MIYKFAIFGIFAPIAILALILLLLILIFEIAMFVSVILNTNISGTTKVLWIIGMLLLHPFVAIAYYFTDYKKTK